MKQMWTGTISFGLIHVPVKLYSATKESRLDLTYLRKKDLCPISYVRVCKETGEEVPFDDIVKGYEYEKGEFVVLDEEDFKKASVDKTETIDIVEFIKTEEVDTMLIEKPYYLEPTKSAQKVYALLREALKKTKKVGLARFVLRTREHIGIVKPQGDMLVLDQLRYQEEIRDASELNIPEKGEFSKQELEMAMKFVDELTQPFKSEDFHDTYTEELLKFIEAKRKGKAVRKVHGEKRSVTGSAPDLMAQLKQSLELAQKGK